MFLTRLVQHQKGEIPRFIAEDTANADSAPQSATVWVVGQAQTSQEGAICGFHRNSQTYIWVYYGLTWFNMV